MSVYDGSDDPRVCVVCRRPQHLLKWDLVVDVQGRRSCSDCARATATGKVAAGMASAPAGPLDGRAALRAMERRFRGP
jgi:hypothetical protein